MKQPFTKETTLNLKLTILLSCFFLSNFSIAQTLFPEITNYSFGSSQNWSIDVNLEQSIAVANNSGLSTFNGQFWEMHKLPKNMIIRSVLCDGDKIYTGSYEEFGYWKNNTLGKLEYHSLKDKFEDNYPQKSEEFWQIIKYDDKIIFRSFGSIYAYDGFVIKQIANDFNISSLAIYNGKLVFGSLNSGLLEITNSEIKPYNRYKVLDNLNSVSHVSSFKNLLFVFDQDEGGYLIGDEKVSKLSDTINKTLKNYSLNKVVFIDNHTLSFGTVKNGVIIYDFIEDNFQIINKQAGLRNNTVLDLKLSDDYLWAALDNGISRINIKSKYSYFNDITGSLGAVYDVAYYNDKYFLASNTGVYTFYDNKLSLIKNSEGHCWGFLQYQNTLFCAHNKGAFILEEDSLLPIEGSFSGVYSYLPIPKSKDLLVSTYSGIGILKKDNNQFVISKLEGINIPIDKLIFENDTTLWATGNYKGLFKINFQNNVLGNLIDLSDNSIISGNKVEIESLKNQLYFVINNNWYKNLTNTKSSNSVIDFKNKSLLSERKNDFWMLDYQTSSIIKYHEDFQPNSVLINNNLVSKFVTGYEKIIYKNDSTIIFNLKDGFSTVDLKKDIESKHSNPKIEKIYVNKNLFKISEKNSIQLNHKQAQLVTFEVYTPGNFETVLQYELTGEINQNDDIAKGRFSIQNLPAGNYSLDVFVKGHSSKKTTIQIEILPPWYLSTVMKVCYLILILIAIYSVGKFQKHKAEKAHLKTQQKLKEEADRKLQLLEKNNLINEIDSRKKELTNSTASIVKKNETIILLRNELKRLEKISPNITRTKNILHRSGEQLDSKNDWHIFETKFNELNEDFFKSLSKEFPKLTTKDRKLCAYIKVGLISKEIAPLLGITVRSVELQRYRLRKKLNLDTDISFIEFLRQF
ncbi:hypothetical protein [Psychroserpens sp. Hel_I_66]|uniref:helix-turn-helix and ligand-binding sensor domain-containing protein n=1 Tax=Psychroserpens sp. Hel_I_66 TaxID=1250004 RepID=UPI00064741F6|nr:hypothetical protein [Psychroserpens sp. Hel_I_66]